MNIILVIIRHMTKITKCPIFLDAMNLKKASKSHFLMVLWLNTLCPLLITLYKLMKLVPPCDLKFFFQYDIWSCWAGIYVCFADIN